ncbi:hypothetical protein ASD78_07655 [Lysobacter sp. Root667]|uniref:DUF1801 domain-containing protein n=1 Tax=Lysobacter sp. Root667 TaxID=1736581 RepID=UPI0006FA44E5|nr:DUF1801 domain-containing protein [Lysobacter sp. Root667]KRA75832.1 hypothetical protein ASD78_07655 [Lysobacter sp. Root667]
MVSSTAETVDAYLDELPPERCVVVATVRDLVNANLPPGYAEEMAFGMIGWNIPLSRYPKTYNKQPLCYAALAAQKNGYSLYLNCVYADSEREQRLRAAYERAGRKFDIGKSCLRFKSPDDLLQSEIAAIVASTSVDEYIALYEAGRRKD